MHLWANIYVASAEVQRGLLSINARLGQLFASSNTWVLVLTKKSGMLLSCNM